MIPGHVTIRKAALKGNSPASISGDRVITRCCSLIADYKRPREVHFLGAPPNLPDGKVHKPRLREMLSGRHP